MRKLHKINLFYYDYEPIKNKTKTFMVVHSDKNIQRSDEIKFICDNEPIVTATAGCCEMTECNQIVISLTKVSIDEKLQKKEKIR